MEKKELLVSDNSLFFWAKKFDTVAHIAEPTNVDGFMSHNGVYCGKFGALLGNNYAEDLHEVCPECLEKYNQSKTK